MLKTLRKQKILQLIKKHQQLSINALAKKLQVTTNTVRVDLKDLILSGDVIRTHGGVSSAELLHGNSIQDLFQTRKLTNKLSKNHIAQILYDHLPQQHGITLFLDASTTVLSLAPLLKHFPYNITIITNFIPLAYELSHYLKIKVILCGGTLWAESQTCIGEDTTTILKNYRADIAILGCAGLSLNEGIFNGNIETTNIKQSMSQFSSEVWLMCDDTKFDKRAISFFSDISTISKVFTNKTPNLKWIEYFTQNNVEYYY